jgi:hypothetical protein
LLFAKSSFRESLPKVGLPAKKLELPKIFSGGEIYLVLNMKVSPVGLQAFTQKKRNDESVPCQKLKGK